MTIISDWAKAWGIPDSMLADLAQRMRVATTPPDDVLMSSKGNPAAENWVQDAVRIEAANHGVTLWRNNVGALLDERGVPVRYGLANDNAKLNKVLKSADLIGIAPLVIEQRHVGTTVGLFASVEAKKATWKWGDAPDREGPQKAWADWVISQGGRAIFARHPSDVRGLL